MKSFIIEQNDHLDRDIQAFFHCEYKGYQQPGNPDFLNTLKNPFNKELVFVYNEAMRKLSRIVSEDLMRIQTQLGYKRLTVCVVPRSKNEDFYKPGQRGFKQAIAQTVDTLWGIENGTDYILRHTNTRTTHLDNSGYGCDGELPYPGITKDTCTISAEVRGKDILLIDDTYTKTVNIDEDAIQALLDQGARNVYFYAVGRTYRKYP